MKSERRYLEVGEMIVEHLGRRKYRLYPDLCTHGSYLVTMPTGELNNELDAERILGLLLESNTRARTLPKFRPAWFEGTDGVRVRLEYEGKEWLP